VHVQAALDAAQQELDHLGGATSGRVRMAGFPSASSTLVPDVLSALRRSRPGLRVDYVEAEPPEALALVRDGSADVALVFGHAGQHAGPTGLRERRVFVDRTVLVVPHDHPFAEGDDFGSLAGERWIGGCPRCRGHLLATCAAAGFSPEIVLETDNALAVLGLVASGLGVALLPGLSLQSAAVPVGVRIVPLDADRSRVISVVHRRGARRVPSVRLVTDAVSAVDPARHSLRRAEADDASPGAERRPARPAARRTAGSSGDPSAVAATPARAGSPDPAVDAAAPVGAPG